MSDRKRGAKPPPSEPADTSPPAHRKASPVARDEPPRHTTTLTQLERRVFQGPIPSPATLAEYNRICPGAANRILAMAESQTLHRQELEREVISSNCRNQDRGPILGFVLAAAVIVIGSYLIFQGREVSGLVALLGALVAVVIPFVYGRREQKRELQRKQQELSSEGDWEYSQPTATARVRSTSSPV